MGDRVSTLIEHGDQLFQKRGQLMSLWQEVAENFYPERADFTAKRTLGEEFAAGLNSSYPIVVRRELGNAFSAMLRPRSEPWFNITIDREERLDRDGKAWLEWATGVQRRAMYDRPAQFIRATKEGDHDFAGFGQCVISHEPDLRQNTLLYRCWHLRDVAWCETYNGSIGTIHRRWKPYARDLMSLFPGKTDPRVAQKLEQNPWAEVNCRHIVMPADQYEAPVGKRWRTPWVSIFVDADHHHVMEEVGLHESPYTIPRWQTVSGSQYAYSPAAVAGLPDARLLQAMTLTLLEAGEMAVRPPMIATKEAIRGDVAIYAGGITWADAEYDERLGEVLRPVTQDKTGIPFGLEMAAQTRELLGAAFYLNKLTLPPADREMTAFETSERIKEYIRTALPLFEPMEIEYNGAICEATFGLLMRGGAFGPPEDIPESIRGADVQFKFKSPLHDAVERKDSQAFVQSAELIATAVELDPTAAAVVDVRKALRQALSGVGAPAQWMRSEEEVEAFAEQQAEQATLEQQAQAVAGAAQAAEQVGLAQQANQAA